MKKIIVFLIIMIFTAMGITGCEEKTQNSSLQNLTMVETVFEDSKPENVNFNDSDIKNPNLEIFDLNEFDSKYIDLLKKHSESFEEKIVIALVNSEPIYKADIDVERINLEILDCVYTKHLIF